MPIPLRAPEPTAGEWKAHDLAVDRCRGTACFAALAIHFNTWSSDKLEQLIDGRKPYVTEGGEKTWSGKYRKWRSEGASPDPSTVRLVLRKTKGVVDVGQVSDLALWDLLRRDPPPITKLQGILETTPRKVRSILFVDSDINRTGRFAHYQREREEMLPLRDMGTLHAVMALLALARMGEILSYDSQHSLASMCAFDALPRLLHQRPELRYRWENLFACLDRVYWRRLYGEGIYLNFQIDRVRANLERLDKEPNAQLDCMSGRLPPRAAP